MRIVVVFSDHGRYISRPLPGDLCLIVREENNKLVIKEQFLCSGLQDNQGEDGKTYQLPVLQPVGNLDEIIDSASKINVEVIAHSSKGGKALQTDPTPTYPLQSIALDNMAHWLEKDLLKNNTPRSTISMLSCEAADGTEKYPALADQLFQLFETKPLKLTARKGFGFIEKKIFSLGTFHTLVKMAVDKKQSNTASGPAASGSTVESIVNPLLTAYHTLFKYPTHTPANEKSVYFLGEDLKSYKMDSHAYKVYLMIRNEPPANQPKIIEIIRKAPENLTMTDIRTLARYGKNTENEKLREKSNFVLMETTYRATELTADIRSYGVKQGLIGSINSLKNYVKNTDECQNKEPITEVLNEALSFITYRHARNYPIENMRALTNLLIDVVMNDGVITPSQFEAFEHFRDEIQSSAQINADASYRRGAVGPRLPSYFSEIKKVTEIKNKAFGEKINEFLEKMADPRAEPPSPG